MACWAWLNNNTYTTPYCIEFFQVLATSGNSPQSLQFNPNGATMDGHITIGQGLQTDVPNKMLISHMIEGALS